jgi:hypothetical protein
VLELDTKRKGRKVNYLRGNKSDGLGIIKLAASSKAFLCEKSSIVES